MVPTDETIDQQTTASITRAEGLSFPILLILLLVIFGSLTAACLPLAIGALAILGSFTALRLLTLITGVSVFSLNITTILGLGLGIDYGLFLVTRFREELRRAPARSRTRSPAPWPPPAAPSWSPASPSPSCWPA